MKNKKRWMCLLLVLIVLFCMVACGAPKKESVVVYSSSEDFRNVYLVKRLREEFPEYEITLQYLSTGNHAAKLAAEGTQTECDIVLELECSYMEQLKEMFAPLDAYDFSPYLDEFVPVDKKYAVWYRLSGAVIVSPEFLADKGLPIPRSYNDLLSPQYKGMISMATPKVSSTGYMFLKNLVNVMGEEEAFKYFDALAENVDQFASSGSGPVNALLQKEVGIGLGITYQAVNAMNNGADLQILYFEEGAPYTSGGFAMIEGREKRKAVRNVFDFLFTTLIYEDKARFAPEPIFKEQSGTLPNYPKHIPYGDMSGIIEIAEKERLLARWTH